MSVQNREVIAVDVDDEILVDGRWYYVTECDASDDYIWAIDPDGEEFEFYRHEVEQVD